ncbi:MAG: aminotransferase class I/II-fold pyridoxal phosphate-dependent enzyme [Deltaproteobacteria bacterium]|nr:aminotransferase class I/II-fold pyridoxal phosphate-dependent enzyme [Deltaproteobacteria bacterium]
MSFRILPASRTKNVRYAIRDIVVQAKRLEAEGQELVFLNIGDPIQEDFETPRHIIDAICDALRTGHTSYCDSAGVSEAREAIRRDAERRGIPSIQEVFATAGVSEGIELALCALVEPGDDFLTPSPGYPLYTALAAKLGTRRNEYRLDEQNGWQPDVEDMERQVTPRTRALVLINPNNPTGSVYTVETVDRVVDVARRHGLVIFADEVYDKFLLDGGAHIPVATRAGNHPVLTFGGLSKNYLGPGLRMGWMTVSGANDALGDYLEALGRLVRARLCANHPIQYAIRPALEGPQDHFEEMLVRLRKRRDLIFARLNAIDGVSCVKPLGAFYAFPRLHDWAGTDAEFVTELMREEGVVCVPGSAFGQRAGTSHFRIVFLPKEDVLEEALDRIERFLARRSRTP